MFDDKCEIKPPSNEHLTENPHINSCRICLDVNTEPDSSIFAKLTEGIKYCDLILLLAPVDMYPNDGLTEKLCNECINNLIGVHNFRTLCLNTDRKLRASVSDEKIIHLKTEITKDDSLMAVATESLEEGELKLNEQYIEIQYIDCTETKDESDEDTKSNYNTIEEEPQRNENLIPDNSLTMIDETESIDEDFYGEEVGSSEFDKDDHDDGGPDILIKQEPIKTINMKQADSKREKRYACRLCSRSFGTSFLLRRHSIVHEARGKQFECFNCHRYFTTKCALVRHSKKHLTDSSTPNTNIAKVFECMLCDKVFDKQDWLTLHMKHHKNNTIQKEFKCKLCPKIFNKLIRLNEHCKTHEEILKRQNDSPKIQQYVCHVCNERFQRSSNLQDHLQIHNSDGPYLCSQCGKSFKNKRNLRLHLIRHTGIKHYACNQCPSRFICRAGLMSHQISHTGVKPYVCDECGAAFTKRYSLGKHNRIHTGEKPYGCNTCAMRFNSSDHLKRHIRTHTGEKPYKCKYCERAFAQSNDLLKHTRSHIGDNVYQCNKCDESFRLKNELKDHISIHFLEENNQVMNEKGTQKVPRKFGKLQI